MEKAKKVGSERRRVGLLFDERMCKHKQPRGDHIENPQRIRAIWDNLNATGLLPRCVVLNAKEAEDDHLALVHSKEHIDLIKTISSKNSKKMKTTANKYDSIYFNKGSSKAAYLAAGFVIEATEQVAKGELDSAFAIVRPPGHHAEESEPMGFCLLNNVAIATSVILNERPELGINKILIVDWDVHHGNSTQKMFYKDPRVLVFSVHRHDFGRFYPEGNDGSYNMVGEGRGAGYNINVPWEGGGVGDADYFAVWDHILLPVAREFDPDLIIISAGFDAGPLLLFGTAISDPIGGCCLSTYGYSIMLYKLMGFARGKIVMALEGGYNLVSLANSTQACIEMLLDYKRPIKSLEDIPLKPTWPLIKTVRQALCKYWPILAAKIPDKVINGRLDMEVDVEISQDKVYARNPAKLEPAQVSGREEYFEEMGSIKMAKKTVKSDGDLCTKRRTLNRKSGKHKSKEWVSRRKGKRKVEYFYSTSEESSGESGESIERRRQSKKKRKIEYSSSCESDDEVENDEETSETDDALDSTTDSSSEDCGRKNVPKKPRNCFGRVKVGQRVTCYRSNLRTLIKEINGLKLDDTVIAYMKRTPFWLLFESIYGKVDKFLLKRTTKHENDILQIIKRFDTKTETFFIGGEMLELESRDVQLIFGITCGKRHIPLKKTTYDLPPWIRRCFKDELKSIGTNVSAPKLIMYKKLILSKIVAVLNNNDTYRCKDVARLLICYMLAILLFTNQNCSVAVHISCYLEDFNEICEFDWPTLIVEMLKKQLKSSKNLKVGGCAIMLPFWLCEHVRLVKPDRRFDFPRFLRWDLNELNKQLQRVSLSKKVEIRRMVLRATSDEKTRLRSLIKFMEDREGSEDFINNNSENDGVLKDGIGDDTFAAKLEDIRAEMKRQTKSFEDQLREKDNKIEQLKKEKDELMQRINEMCIPTATQIYEQLHTLKIGHEEVLRENNYLKGLIPSMNNTVQLDETSCEKGTKISHQSDPSTITRVVKRKTENNERKAKEVTPQPSTRELIKNVDVQEACVHVCTKREFHRQGKFKLDEKFPAVRKLNHDMKDHIIDLWELKGEGYVVWKGKGSFSEVVVKDILNILHNKGLKSSVIDSWADMLQYNHLKIRPSVKYTVVFTSMCLNVITGHETSSTKRSNVNVLIDNRLDEVIDADYLIFPIIGTTCKTRGSNDDHWTILRLNMKTSEWRFFNSMLPRTASCQDPHLTDAVVVAKYVASKLSETLKRLDPEHPFLKKAHRSPETEPCLQQIAGSLDSGIIVCFHIENTLLGKPLQKGVFDEESAADYRRRMVEWFVEPDKAPQNEGK